MRKESPRFYERQPLRRAAAATPADDDAIWGLAAAAAASRRAAVARLRERCMMEIADIYILRTILFGLLCYTLKSSD